MLQEAAVQTFRLKPLHTPSFWLCFSKQALLPPASPLAVRVGCEFLWVPGSRLICSRQPPWSLGNAAGSPWVFHQHPLEDEGSVEQGRSVCWAGSVGFPSEQGSQLRANAGWGLGSWCWGGMLWALKALGVLLLVSDRIQILDRTEVYEDWKS